MKARSGMTVSFFFLTWYQSIYLPLTNNKVLQLILGLHGLQDVFSIELFRTSAARINCITVPNLWSHFASISHNCQRMSHDSPTPVGTSFYSTSFYSMSLFSNTALLTIWSHFITLHNVVGTIILPKVLERNEISWLSVCAFEKSVRFSNKTQ